MTRSVIFISLDGMTDSLGQSQVIPYLTGLSNRGYRITIISCEKKKNFETNHLYVSKLLSDKGIQWKYCFYSQRLPLLSQRGNFSRLKKLALEHARSSEQPLIVHCRSYLPAMIGRHLKKHFGARLLFDMRGFWADERVEGNIWNLRNPLHKRLYRFFKRKEKELLADADLIITLTEKAKQILAEWGVQKKEIKVIPCCADTEFFPLPSEETKAEARKSLGLTDSTFVWGYLGSFGTWYMLDEMLDFFKAALKTNPDSKLLFITLENPSGLKAHAAKRDVNPKNMIVRAAKRSEVPYYLSAFNAGLFFIRPTFSKQASSPTKMAELLACGVPVVTNKGVGDSDKIIEESKCGVLVQDFTTSAYDAAIRKMGNTHFSADKLRNAAIQYFSLEKGVAIYDDAYRELSK